jgi:hypothetical protein
VFFYYLPHSPYAAAEPTTTTQEPRPSAPPVSAPAAAARSFSTTTKPSSLNSSSGAGNPVHPAAQAAATSIRARGRGGFGQNVRIQHKKNNPLIKQTLQSVVERCYAIGDMMKKEQGGVIAF